MFATYLRRELGNRTRQTAIVAIGAVPRYVDVDQSLTMSPAALEEVIGSGVRRALMAASPAAGRARCRCR